MCSGNVWVFVDEFGVIEGYGGKDVLHHVELIRGHHL